MTDLIKVSRNKKGDYLIKVRVESQWVTQYKLPAACSDEVSAYCRDAIEDYFKAKAILDAK